MASAMPPERATQAFSRRGLLPQSKTIKGWSVSDHPFSFLEGLEEHLQTELDSPGDIALAAGRAKRAGLTSPCSPDSRRCD